MVMTSVIIIVLIKLENFQNDFIYPNLDRSDPFIFLGNLVLKLIKTIVR